MKMARPVARVRLERENGLDNYIGVRRGLPDARNEHRARELGLPDRFGGDGWRRDSREQTRKDGAQVAHGDVLRDGPQVVGERVASTCDDEVDQVLPGERVRYESTEKLRAEMLVVLVDECPQIVPRGVVFTSHYCAHGGGSNADVHRAVKG